MRPASHSGWRERKAKAQAVDDGPGSISFSVWERRSVFVISSLKFAEAPDGTKDIIEQWHLSASFWTGEEATRIDDATAKQVLACFGLAAAEEDNHHPGIARQWWLPVERARRVDCECKATEVVVTEPDGFRWSNSRDPLQCAGCELEVIMEGEFGTLVERPCPIHRPAEATA